MDYDDFANQTHLSAFPLPSTVSFGTWSMASAYLLNDQVQSWLKGHALESLGSTTESVHISWLFDLVK